MPKVIETLAYTRLSGFTLAFVFLHYITQCHLGLVDPGFPTQVSFRSRFPNEL